MSAGTSWHFPTDQNHLNPQRLARLALAAFAMEGCYTYCSRSAQMLPHHCSDTTMPRPRYRACLQDGLKLDLNALARRGFIKFGANIGARGISWSNSHQGAIASGIITADMTDPSHAWFRIAIGGFVQQIALVSRPRHFGGRQWFFQCPATHRLATVLWKPPGATKFCKASLGQASCLSIAIPRS